MMEQIKFFSSKIIFFKCILITIKLIKNSRSYESSTKGVKTNQGVKLSLGKIQQENTTAESLLSLGKDFLEFDSKDYQV